MHRRPEELATRHRKVELIKALWGANSNSQYFKSIVKKRSRKHLPLKGEWKGLDKRQFKAIKRSRRAEKQLVKSELYISGELVLEPYRPRNEGKWG